MDALKILSEPNDSWDYLCRKNNNLFHSTGWQQSLNFAFPSETLYVLNDEEENSIAITIFKAGPFRIGYVGFPVGGAISGVHFSETEFRELLSLDFPTRLDFLRIPVSPFMTTMSLNLSYSKTYETAIIDLQEWDKARLSKSVRSSIRRAEKSGIKVIDIGDDDARILYKLYCDTVKRHHGALRYNEKYFHRLAQLSLKIENMRIMVAMYEGIIIGFIIVVLNNNTAYYLHGAIEQEYKRFCASDLLLYAAIQWAKSAKMDVFNLMTSPVDQPTLVRYKEKWKGITRIHKTYEMDIMPLNSKLFRIIMPAYKSIASILSR